MRILALDVGGTAIKSAILEPDGTMIDQRLTPSGISPVEVMTEKAAAVAKAYDAYDVLAVSMTGQLDHKTQTIRAWSNGTAFETISFPVGKRLRDQVGRPVFVLNDANAATLGEACFGAGGQHQNLLCLTYGTGVGGGIIQNGKLLTGARGLAGEFGHLVTHPGGHLCRCGHRGCYQQYASASALLRDGQQILPELKNARELFEKLPEEKRLQEVVDNWITEIVLGLCSLAYLFDPECFILGGGVMERQDVLAKVQAQFQKAVIPSFAGIQILGAELGNKAGMLGAFAYARQAMAGNTEDIEV